MSRKKKIEPNMILVIGMHNFNNIPLIIVDKSCTIQLIDNVGVLNSNYMVRKNCIDRIKVLIEQYGIDMILFEENKLFIDKIDKYPDPFVLRNIVFAYGLQIAIEDNFYESIPYIMAIPQYEWRRRVLRKSNTYAIDLFKSHILLKNYSTEQLDLIDKFNYYETLCLSECILYDEFLKEKYQINN